MEHFEAKKTVFGLKRKPDEVACAVLLQTGPKQGVVGIYSILTM